MFNISSGKVTFKKGTKPRTIKEAQRETRSIYADLCSNNAPRGLELARVFYLDKILGKSAETLFKYSPYYMSYVSAASRAYSATGNSLMKKQMYHMDVSFSLDDLSHFKDLPSDLIAKLKETGEQEFLFMAREL